MRRDHLGHHGHHDKDDSKEGIPIPPSKPKIWSMAEMAVCKTPPPNSQHWPQYHPSNMSGLRYCSMVTTPTTHIVTVPGPTCSAWPETVILQLSPAHVQSPRSFPPWPAEWVETSWPRRLLLRHHQTRWPAPTTRLTLSSSSSLTSNISPAISTPTPTFRVMMMIRATCTPMIVLTNSITTLTTLCETHVYHHHCHWLLSNQSIRFNFNFSTRIPQQQSLLLIKIQSRYCWNNIISSKLDNSQHCREN